MVGDYAEGELLTTTATHFKRTIAHIGKRNNPKLNEQSSESALELIDSMIYKTDKGTPEGKLYERYKRYSKFVICPGGGEPFDGWLAILLEDLNFDRFIWQQCTHDRKVNEVKLPKQEYESTVQTFLTWFDSEKM